MTITRLHLKYTNICRVCGGPSVRAKNGHYLKHCRRHKNKRNLLDIHDMYTKTDGCWEWQGTISAHGYAHSSKDSRPVPAARLVYKELVGDYDHTKYHLDHLCYNRKCVNPAHLEVVTLKENMRRRRCTKLSMRKANKIRKLWKEGVSQTKIASLYKVDQALISRIVNNKIWL